MNLCIQVSIKVDITINYVLCMMKYNWTNCEKVILWQVEPKSKWTWMIDYVVETNIYKLSLHLWIQVSIKLHSTIITGVLYIIKQLIKFWKRFTVVGRAEN